MLDSLEVYLDNIAAAATQTAANGVPLEELSASLDISVNTAARQKQGIKRLSEQINALKKNGGSATSGATVPGETIMYAKIVKRLAARHRKEKLMLP